MSTSDCKIHTWKRSEKSRNLAVIIAIIFALVIWACIKIFESIHTLEAFLVACLEGFGKKLFEGLIQFSALAQEELVWAAVPAAL